jgi:SAM-dependent methyltransferase
MTGSTSGTDLREGVRDHYAELALKAGAPGCCGSGSAEGTGLAPVLYGSLQGEGLPDAAVLASLGCGNPTAVAELRPGETVLDLGSGGGIDVLLSARRVGPAGKVYGLDMTDEMLALAIKNRNKAGATNVEILKGYIEQVPLPAGTVDVVISNCVVNLSTDKAQVFSEMYRVLRPGGRIGIADIVAGNDLTPGERAERGNYVDCVAGALSFAEYETGLRAAGFDGISIVSINEGPPGIHSAIVKATKPEPGEGPKEDQ